MSTSPPYEPVETHPLVGVFDIEGEDMEDIAFRLEDLAHRLRERPEAPEREIVGGRYIAVVRPRANAPKVHWKPSASSDSASTAPEGER